MSRQPNLDGKQAKRLKCSQDLRWMYYAYCLARRAFTKPCDEPCIPITLHIAGAVTTVLDCLEAIEEAQGSGAATSLESLPALAEARLYAAALGYLDTLYARTLKPIPPLDELVRRATAARDFMRNEVIELREDGLLQEGTEPARRGSTARAIGVEVLELVEFGRRSQLFCAQDDYGMYGKLFDAELVGERLLTAIGERDAPRLPQQIRAEHGRAYTLLFEAWARAGDGVTQSGDPRLRELWVPALYSGQA